jgi:hypothetical protein
MPSPMSLVNKVARVGRTMQSKILQRNMPVLGQQNAWAAFPIMSIMDAKLVAWNSATKKERQAIAPQLEA